MKHATSLQAIEIGQSLAKNAKQGALKLAPIPGSLDTRTWMPSESPDIMTECSKLSCGRVFPLKEGYTHPLPYVRSYDEDGIPTISTHPLLVFCSIEHLLMPAVVMGTTISQDGYTVPRCH